MTHRSAIAGQGGGVAWVPPAGLLGWWYGDSTTGGAWTDRSGAGNHATLFNEPTLSADGMACVAASKQYAQSPAIYAASEIRPVTLCAWIRRAASPDKGMAVEQYASRGVGVGWGGISQLVAGNNAIIHNLSIAWVPASPAVTIGTGWRHLALTVAGTTHLMYLDAVLVHTYASAFVAADGAAPIIIGGDPSGVRASTCTFDDAMAYGAALTQEQIADIMANSPGSHAT